MTEENKVEVELEPHIAALLAIDKAVTARKDEMVERGTRRTLVDQMTIKGTCDCPSCGNLISWTWSGARSMRFRCRTEGCLVGMG